jgi:hypothetical protein
MCPEIGGHGILLFRTRSLGFNPYPFLVPVETIPCSPNQVRIPLIFYQRRSRLLDQNEADEKTRIRNLNDSFRASGQGGRIVSTQGIQQLSPVDKAAVFGEIRLFDACNQANDPHGEHDFGSIEYGGEKILFKIGYYDQGLEDHSENPRVDS